MVLAIVDLGVEKESAGSWAVRIRVFKVAAEWRVQSRCGIFESTRELKVLVCKMRGGVLLLLASKPNAKKFPKRTNFVKT